jgi:hypothetical protein
MYEQAILDIETNAYLNNPTVSPVGVVNVFSASRKQQCVLQTQYYLVT